VFPNAVFVAAPQHQTGSSRPGLLRALLDEPFPGTTAERTPALIAAMLEDAEVRNASDIHLDPAGDDYAVRLRIDGVLIDEALLGHGLGLHLLRSLKSQADLDPGFELRPQSGRAEFAIKGRTLSVRVATAPGVRGEKIVLRLLTCEAAGLTLGQLGLGARDQDEILAHVQDVRGMIQVSGPAGAGKTTTLYALVKELKQSGRSIVSLEDPVEYTLDGVTQIQINEKQGVNFVEGVKGLLRLDPDVIVVGEMRDRASALAALEAAECGHACLSTLHARDVAGTITVLRNLGYSDNDIAAAVDLVIAQRLVRRLCEKCRRQEPPTEGEKQLLNAWGQPVPAQTWHAVGCEHCGGGGYLGRVGIFEVYRLREEDADLVLAHADERTLRRHIRRRGATSLLDDLLRKSTEGVTSLAEIRSVRGFGFYSP